MDAAESEIGSGGGRLNQLALVWQSARPPFLLLALVCAFLGLATAVYTLQAGMASVDYLLFLVVLVGAVAAHIAVNTLNEYLDFRSGLDNLTRRTPFSGGSGLLPRHPEVAEQVLHFSLAAIVLTCAIGIYLLFTHSEQLLPIGLAGVVIIIAYTRWINRYPFICLIAPGVGFGLLMVVGTHLVMAGEYGQPIWFAALIPFFLVNNLLLLNQYPDIEADRQVGRNHFPIAFGTRISAYAYGAFLFAAMLVIIFAVVAGYFPIYSLAALLPLLAGVLPFRAALLHGAQIGSHPQFLGMNVVVTLLTPLLLGVSLLV
ncbi:MAG: prenyltransferase [Gammaproteobacteria bacterium]|nr:prenyltransferase [Gammaproteobacteria bacterium]